MKPSDILTKDFLLEEYVVKGKSYETIAQENQVSRNSVAYYIKKFNITSRESKNPKCYDIIGQKFGRWTVLSRSLDNKSGKYYRSKWLCRCDCGKEKYVFGYSLRKKQTQSCGCVSTDLTSRKYKDISGTYWYILQRNASKRGINFTISIEDLWNIFESQNKKCALTGLDIAFDPCYSGKRKHGLLSTQTASVDRIDSSKDYTIDNVQIVHKTINLLKNTLSNEELIIWARRISDHVDSKARRQKVNSSSSLANK